ncbi:hypothetical protein CORC01_06651 [Colletotrichum orchidophilum]|uniref:Xylanolytic transcriptional activator regulatory domain-containing protein n=1 Tax=Colletotrichum orchidophilum TaxID=1209926 RepID=A0A1G4B9M3_9PEZI|nr:uncharacterized protein CORC01_06651 [Colletotrichum orchidophilum]OHE97982.1 hypothetical protein CORC01_06651 [Colletotrichum orchidophilum]
MDPTWESQFPPTVSKACSRCRARKVKNEQCNITDCVTYTYAAVKSLQHRISQLEFRLNASPEGTASQPAPVAETGQFDDVRKAAEEIGVLAIGRPSGYSDRIYMGSATGSTFARIFFKQIHLVASTSRSARQELSSQDHELARNNAALPPQPVARFLLTTNHGDDLWQMSRYAMSTAIEMGLHRRSTTPGDLNSDDREIRNRTWWCVYTLERQVAVITGRVLSVREHAIDAPKPCVSTLDDLTDYEARAAPVFQKLNVKLFNHLVGLRQIGGRILESVYIARGTDGRASRNTFQEICNEVGKIQQELESWKRDMESLNVKGTREYSEMKIEYSLLLLLMYRPSPTFMIPSKEMVEICSRAVSGTVRQWLKLEFQHGITAICGCVRQVHSILMVGLAGLYCDWHMKAMTQSPESPLLYSHGSNVASCMDLIERGTARMKEEGLLKYRDLLQAARIKVYGPTTWEPRSVQTQATDASSVAPVDPSSTLGLIGPDNLQSHLFFQGDGLETYMNQVTGYFDNTQLGLDEGLTAWFGTFMDELQSNQNRELV